MMACPASVGRENRRRALEARRTRALDFLAWYATQYAITPATDHNGRHFWAELAEQAAADVLAASWHDAEREGAWDQFVAWARLHERCEKACARKLRWKREANRYEAHR